MTTFAEEMQAVAIDLITEFGQSVSFSRVTEGTYNTSNSAPASGSTITYTAYGVPMDYSAFEISTKSVLSTDLKLLIHKTTQTPQVGDVATFGGVAYRVMDVNKEVANGQDIYFSLQVRK